MDNENTVLSSADELSQTICILTHNEMEYYFI